MLFNDDGDWLALYTRAKCERVVFDQLKARNITTLLPSYDRIRGHGRILFPGYVFVRVTLQQRRIAAQVPRVVHFVSLAGEPAIIPEDQLRPYLLAEQQGIPLQPWPFLKRGSRVRIVRGPLSGLEGIFDRRRGTGRLVLNVEILAGAAAIEISSDAIEPATKRSGG